MSQENDISVTRSHRGVVVFPEIQYRDRVWRKRKSF